MNAEPNLPSAGISRYSAGHDEISDSVPAAAAAEQVQDTHASMVAAENSERRRHRPPNAAQWMHSPVAAVSVRRLIAVVPRQPIALPK
jgi:hypothetical protein